MDSFLLLFFLRLQYVAHRYRLACLSCGEISFEFDVLVKFSPNEDVLLQNIEGHLAYNHVDAIRLSRLLFWT